MIYLFTRYGRLGASSRIRTMQYFDQKNILSPNLIFFNNLINDKQLLYKYLNKKYNFFSIIISYLKRLTTLISCSSSDLIYIEKELYPFLPYFIESLFLINKKYILNYDDAVFDYYESHKNKLVRRILSKKHKFLMKNSCLTICGNRFLANYAKDSGCKSIEILPTVINLKKYRKIKNHSNIEKPIICWIGSPSSLQHLKTIDAVFQELAKEKAFILKIIGIKNYQLSNVEVICKEWSEELEVNELITSDIGIMPLNKTRFSLGKCGYKIIQFMGTGLPVVASKLGENINIINENKNGYLANSKSEWIKFLKILLSDFKLRSKMGFEGRKIVENQFSIQSTKKTFISFFEKNIPR